MNRMSPEPASGSPRTVGLAVTRRNGRDARARLLLSWSVLSCWLLLGCQVLFGGVEVHQSSAAGAECTFGDTRCNGEYLLTCGSKDTGWMLKDTCASGDLCDAKQQRCSVCKDGDYRCLGVARQRCVSDGSHFETVESCSAENLCSESSCSGCSTDGALDCSVAPLLRECRGGVWVTLDSCATQNLCSATTAFAMTTSEWDRKCITPACPVAGAYRCEGAMLQRCPPQQDGWVMVDTCASAALCENAVARVGDSTDKNAPAILDMCKPGCPDAGAFVCDGSTLLRCKEDQTAYETVKTCEANTECDPGSGDCGQLCVPGQYQCNGATLRKCGSTGHWADLQKCETAALCSVTEAGQTGTCTPSPCANQPYRCSGAKLQKCREDRTGYDDNTSCASPALCDAPSARCIPVTCPTASAYQCFGQDLKQCASDLTHWTPITTCPAGQYCDSGSKPGCLTACPVNPVRCNGKLLEHCSAATGWTTQATCSTPDLCSCALTDPDGAGPLTNSCLSGLYKDGCGNVVCGGIKALYQCQGAELQKCQAGRNGWDKAEACGAANLCYPGEAPSYASGSCLTCPTAGELACNASTLRVCSADRRAWNTSQTCGNGCIAVQNGQDYCAACKVGAVQCSGTTLQTCPADQRAWVNTTCASAALCDATNKQCDVCSQTVCAGNVLQKCSNGGQTLQSQTCAGVCDAANAQCDKCAASSVWCDGAVLNRCSADGQTQTSVTCVSAPLCDKAKNVCQPPKCAVGEQRCTDATLQICNADRTDFKDVATCASAALCDKSKPACIGKTCSANEKRCGAAGQPEICNAALTSWMPNGPACASAALCDPKTFSCNACAVGGRRCKDNNSQICNATKSGFVDDTDCGVAGCNTATNLCNVAICTPNKFDCDGLGLLKCNATGTAWVPVQTCATICDKSGGECDECVAPAFLCTATNALQSCDASGHWGDAKDCLTDVCNATLGTCDAPPMPPPMPAP